MKRPDIEFYQGLCPALKAEGWEWPEYQTFHQPRAWRSVGRIEFNGVKSKRLAEVVTFYNNNGQSSHYSVLIRSLDYPDFRFTQDVSINAYQCNAESLFTQALKQANELLQSNLGQIIAKEQSFLDELAASI